MPKERLQLFHWNEEETKDRVARLKKLGYAVQGTRNDHGQASRDWKENPPAAFVIELSRLPSHGKQIGYWIRSTKHTRQIPIVFIEGEPEKVAKIRELLPDAVYSNWKSIQADLKWAIANPPLNAKAPQSNSGGYSGTPLPKKLGIQPNSEVALIDAPKGFEKTLGQVPEGVKLSKSLDGKPALTLWFTTEVKELKSKIKKMGRYAESGRLWIIWPKQTSKLKTDLKEGVIRETALASGLVDYKVCAVDADWSGLKFSRKKT